MIIVLGGIKGGSGKTTIATNLAVMRAKHTGSVLLVDADEQESSTVFSTIRNHEHPELPQCTSIILRDDQVRHEVAKMQAMYADIVIDTGGRDTRSQRAGLSVADLLILPFNPRSLDIWTIDNVERLLKDMWTINPDLKAVSVLNRADPVGADNADAREILMDVAGIPFSGATLVNRKIYGRAVSQGLGVSECRPMDYKACDEVMALYEYVFGMKAE